MPLTFQINTLISLALIIIWTERLTAVEADTPAARIEGAREKIVLQRDGKGGVKVWKTISTYWETGRFRMKEKDPEKPNRIPR